MANPELRSIFLINRAEQYPLDVWNEFVIPINFHTLDMKNDRKSVIIIGGRGSGKTMFMRYFCHQTTFSKNRTTISSEETRNIGIYWKPDIKFCRFLDKNWFSDNEKEHVFLHYASLYILQDFFCALDSLNHKELAGGGIDICSAPIPKSLNPFLDDDINKLGDLSGYIEIQISIFDLWVKGEGEKPKFLTFNIFIEKICEALSKLDARLNGVFFRVFIDEFENLKFDQQRHINDYIKNPGKFFSINIARRRYSKVTNETSGFEQITNIHDYRLIDLEKQFLDGGKKDFSLFAAEILIFRAIQKGFNSEGVVFDIPLLKNKDRLCERYENNYKKNVLEIAGNIFPQLSIKEVAANVICDKALMNRWEKQVVAGLKIHNSKALISEFMLDGEPEATLVTACLLNRTSDKYEPAVILNELNLLKTQPAKSKFSGDGGWSSTNIYGQLLYLYIGLRAKPCPLYAGFDRFCSLARGNLRVFQELCHQSFVIYESENMMNNTFHLPQISIPITIQAEAARIASDNLLSEVEKFGNKGQALKRMAYRLGKLFQIAQKRKTQSEPEINHFSITDENKALAREQIEELLSEGNIWSVVYTQRDTKNKSSSDRKTLDYILNPIYSPYFGISYRRKRKLTLTSQEFLTIIGGSDDDFERLISQYDDKWNANLNDQSDLFNV